MMMMMHRAVTRRDVPQHVLLLSLLALAVPVVSSALMPGWTNQDLGFLVWVLALIPAFLLSYHRGWRGASLGLAAAMATFSVAEAIVVWLGANSPRPELMVAAVVVLIAVALGSGWVAEAFHRALHEAQRLALTDANTGAPNRRHAILHLQRAFAAADRGASLAVVLFDIDHFKRVNDSFGHERGDEVLREFAAVLKRLTRAEHLAARFGGEEFIAIMDGGRAQNALRYAESVRAAFSSRCEARGWGRITVSAGIAEYERPMASPEVLVAAADQALYRAKQEGRDRSVVRERAAPCADGPVKLSPQLASAPPAEGHGETVLVVDDDPGVVRVVVASLKRRGFNALGASDPERALAIVGSLSEPVDLLVVDLIMPVMSGFRMVEILTQTQHPVRALYMSGNPVEGVDWTGVPGTVKAFLAKPFNLDDLVRSVRTVLDTPAPRPARIVREHVPATAETFEQPPGPEMLTPELDDVFAEMLQRLAWATDFRDDATGEHARRVGWLAGRIAEEIGLPEPEVALIEHAAPLHDVGKIAIPDSILKKPAPLTRTEWNLMQDHCTAGARILGGSKHPLVRCAYLIALSHHERWDGTGYPHGLKGESIPLPGRITAVADAFDALTTARPYRAALPPAAAVERLISDAGTLLDPEAVAAFVRLYRRGALQPLIGIDQADPVGTADPGLSALDDHALPRARRAAAG